MTASPSSALQKLLALLRLALERGTFVKLSFGGPCGPDPTLRSASVRLIQLREGPRLSFVFRHDRRDLTQNFPTDQGVEHAAALLGRDFRHAHLFTTEQTAELEWRPDRPPRLRLGPPRHAAPPGTAHDHVKARPISPSTSPWLHELGVTTPDGTVCEGMAAKYRQINKFTEILEHLLGGLPASQTGSLTLVDMGSGKGYLTFAAYEYLRRTRPETLAVRGLEVRGELVELCNRVARGCGFEGLSFACGTIAEASAGPMDILVALHACDTATDDALAGGVRAGARLILAAPCCHKELRPQLCPPPVLAGALRHGILLERQAEFVTDALRAALLEWAGYDTKVFEFIAAEHTAKNLMIAATRRDSAPNRDLLASQARHLAAFYGLRSQRLAQALGFELLRD